MYVWRAWWRLHSDRPWHGGGFGPATPSRIPWRDVLAWCEVHGHDTEFVDACFAAMDAEFFAHHGRQAQAALNKGKTA